MVKMIRYPLFVPADRPDRFDKAAQSAADALILDLEDAVAVDAKDMARKNIASEFTDEPVMVRINGLNTPWFEADLAAVAEGHFAAVVIPKAERAVELANLAETLPQTPIVALIESAEGIANARAIAEVANVVRLAFGSIDYCADLGCDHERDALLMPRSALVLASKLGGIAPPIDGVTAAIKDTDLCNADARHARSLGMTGKLCIHPSQIEPVKRAFAPTESEIAWAKRVMEAEDGASSVDGQMVDAPVRLRAAAILESQGLDAGAA